jgi:DNA-binding transcriptional LysR family regulator
MSTPPVPVAPAALSAVETGFELKDLRAFVAVVETGGFRAAASQLRVSQPSVSRSVAVLERATGARLFERSTRTVRLTTAGS